MGVTVKAVLDTRRKKKDLTYPMKLRLTYRKTQKYYPMNLSYSEKEYEEILSAKKGVRKATQDSWRDTERKAEGIVESMKHFSFDEFTRLYLRPEGEHTDIFYRFRLLIDELYETGKASNHSIYKNAKNALQGYCNYLSEKGRLKAINGVVHFSQIDKGFLKGFEDWFLDQDKSVTSVAMYVRCFRKVFNDAIETGDIDREIYPFGRNGYEIPEPGNPKRALKLDDIKQIHDFEPRSDSERLYRDIWLFSYLCGGINVADIARLRYENIDGDTLNYRRQKTRHNKRRPIIRVHIPDRAMRVVMEHGTKPPLPKEYIFPFLKRNLDPHKEHALVHQVNKQVNKYIKKVASEVGIEENITSYTARHSAATILRDAGESIHFISKMLGHTDIKIVEDYLKSFEDDQRKTAASKLTDF